MSSKLPSLPLFTDTFTADTVHLTNEAVGIYIRLLCFNWTKGSVPFTRENAYRVGQCKSEECKKIVTPIPIPKPIPIPNNILLEKFNVFWSLLRVKNGSKKLAQQKYLTHCKDFKPEDIANTFNRLVEKTKDKTFVPHVCTWLNQERWLDEETSKPKEIKIPDVFYNGIKLKKRGEFGHYEEYEDDKGNRYQKHKFKKEEIMPTN